MILKYYKLYVIFKATFLLPLSLWATNMLDQTLPFVEENVVVSGYEHFTSAGIPEIKTDIIYGKENIHLKTQYQSQPFPFSTQNQNTTIAIGADRLITINNPTIHTLRTNKTNYQYNDIAAYLLAMSIPAPPPECP